MYNKYLSTENPNKPINEIIKKYLNGSITTDSSGISQEQPFDNNFKKKKKKKFDVNEKVYITADEIIDSLGGIDYFKRNFNTVEKAKKYIEKNILDIIKIFRETQNDIPWEEINKLLNKNL